jgi:aspartate/methionine/tyrosine aminotransferase
VAEDAVRARTRANLAAVRDAVAGSPASLLDVEGGWYATLRVPGTRSEQEWALALLEEDGVHVHPGHFFDFEREAYLVVSLLTPPADLEQAVRRIVARVSAG